MEQKHPIMTIKTTQNTIRIELYPESAPNAVASVIKIAKAGLYDQRQIRRIAPGFVVQPSFTFFDDPQMAMMIPGEFSTNGFEHGAIMKEGSVGMGGEKNISSGSEFFFCLNDETGKQLQGKFSVIGQVIEGWEEVKRLEQVSGHRLPIPGRDDVIVYIPDEPEYMLSVTVDTFGVDYPDPQILGYEKVPVFD